MQSTKPPPPIDFLRDHGPALLRSGYEVLPIKPGQKGCLIDGWQSLDVTPQRLDRWLANGHAHDGLGVRTRFAPAIDIDVTDATVADALEAWCQEHVGMAPVRVGRAPKRLLAYRAETPFRKLSSTWTDPSRTDPRTGKPVEQKVEILGDGQQYVAYAVHPDTQQPYRWSGTGLLRTPRESLDLLTEGTARAALVEFDRLASEAGWTRKGPNPLSTRSQPTTGPLSDDDPLANIGQDPLDVSDQDVSDALAALPPDVVDDYDSWLHVGMALHHQYQGTDDGLSLWHEWSAGSGKYTAETLDAKWRGFNQHTGPRKTIRYVLMLARQAGWVPAGRVAAPVAPDALPGLEVALQDAASVDDLRAAVKAAPRWADVDTMQREAMVASLRRAWQRVAGSTLPVSAARTLLRDRPTGDDHGGRPAWLDPWVYVTHDDTFWSTDAVARVTRAGFDAKYNRLMLSAADRAEGRTAPSTLASSFAHGVGLPVKDNVLYLPGAGKEFTMNGKEYANSYRDDLVPKMPKRMTPPMQASVAKFIDHFTHLFADPRERGIALSSLANIVQGGSRQDWAIVIVGPQGVGKSILLAGVAAILGEPNVKTISPDALASEFTGWAEGAQFAFIEEIKLHGHNKFDVLNGIKVYVANDTIPIRRMRTDPYNAPNTQTYWMASNHKDALPLDEEDSRYFVIYTRQQSRAEVKAFNAANPTYYDDLIEAIREHPGALRKWFMDYKLHPEFRAKGRAPFSPGALYMARLAKPIENDYLDLVIDESTDSRVALDLLDQERLADLCAERGMPIPEMWRVKAYLNAAGWTFIGYWTVGREPRHLWTREPDQWQDDVGNWRREAIKRRWETEI